MYLFLPAKGSSLVEFQKNLSAANWDSWMRGIIKTSENVFISEAKHKTFAEVNEEGTEVAAVTFVTASVAAAMQPRKPLRMIVVHPFFCAIRDNKTGTLLFMGSITDPM